MVFNYKALTQSGETIEGTYEASSEAEVIAMLRTSDNIPLNIEEDIEKAKEITVFNKKVNKRDLAIFCRQFHTMLDAGVGIVRALDILFKQTENKSLKIALEFLHEEVQKGTALSQAMSDEKKTFPSLLVNMVEAGEVSGNLDEIMERMAIHYENEYKLENKVKSALIYPIVLAVVSISVVVIMLVFVMPTFMEMFESSGQELPGLTKALISISDFMVARWYIILGILVAIIVGLRIWSRTDEGAYAIDQVKIKFPGVKHTMIKLITARFTRTLSTLMSSGISLLQALQIVSKAIGNKVIEVRISESVDEIRKGMTLSNAIKNIDIFPVMVDSMVSIGEESGSLDEMLAKTADFYDEEVEVSLQRMTTLLEPIMIIFMAVIIGFIVIAMALPMFDMANVI